jgi:NAD(P)-dependent dehydrogenase (short-subunit alcohol dehydrogenase family)
MTDKFLKGQTALVTGGARNLGRGFAEMLAHHGANVTVHYHGEKARSDAETTASVVAESAESIEAIKHWTGGLGNVKDVVPLVEFLVSPGAHWLTGQTIFVNGGVVTR